MALCFMHKKENDMSRIIRENELKGLLETALLIFYKCDAQALFGHNKDIDERAMVGCIYRYMWCAIQCMPMHEEIDIDIEYDRMSCGNAEGVKKQISVCGSKCAGCCHKGNCYDLIDKAINDHKTNKDSYEFRPDIIVHKRNTNQNYMVIEFKKRGLRISRDAFDVAKVMLCTCKKQAFMYQIGAFVKLEERSCDVQFYNFGEELTCSTFPRIHPDRGEP